jgi:hypothetical protein
MSHNILFDVAYTWSHATAVTSYDPVVANNHVRNYGSSPSDSRQNLQVSWSYHLPDLSTSLRRSMMGKFGEAILDHWTYAGHYQAETGGPLFVSMVDISSTDYPGSQDETVRPNVVYNPMSNAPAGFNFNPACYASPAVGSMGTEGIYSAQSRGINNWGMTLTKFIPIGVGESRGFSLEFQSFNAFNHPQFGTDANSLALFAGLNSTPINATSLGTPNGDPPGPRVLAFQLGFKF